MTDETQVISEPHNALDGITLEQLPESLREAMQRAGWESLMPVQTSAIPYLLAKRDLMVQSRTGSGKTGAFVLPMLERIDATQAATQALILTPTRELALQVSREVELLCGAGGVRSVAVYGGVGYGPQLEALRAGAHIVVGTPGRVLDHLLRGTLSLDDLALLVFDEADRMLSMGFYPDMRRIQAYLPKRAISTYMFSATYPPQVMRLANQFLHKPDVLSLSTDHVHVTEVEHVYYIAPTTQRERSLVRIIEVENPSSAIVFCNTKADVNLVSVVLQRFGYDADMLTSDLSQNARERVLGKLRRGQLRFLVATDVAARGIDIPDLSHVIQFQPPEDPEGYIHRAGRTGRAGASGEAITLVSSLDRADLRLIEQRFSIQMQERELPTPEDVANVITQRLTATLEARLRSLDRVQKERLERLLPFTRQLAETEDEWPLIAMLLDEAYVQALHSPPPAPEAPPEERSSSSGNEGGGAAPTKKRRRPRRKRKPR